MVTTMVTTIGRKAESHLYIKEWFDHLGVSDKTVANRLGKARETIWKWRTQPGRLKRHQIAALAEACNIDPSAFERPPESRPSLDALVKGAPDHVQDMVVDVVRRMVGRN